MHIALDCKRHRWMEKIQVFSSRKYFSQPITSHNEENLLTSNDFSIESFPSFPFSTIDSTTAQPKLTLVQKVSLIFERKAFDAHHAEIDYPMSDYVLIKICSGVIELHLHRNPCCFCDVSQCTSLHPTAIRHTTPNHERWRREKSCNFACNCFGWAPIALSTGWLYLHRQSEKCFLASGI